MNRNCDILIVGAGLGGLFTGVYLSKKGYRVLLLEKSSQLGGYSTSIVFDGLSFDVGGPQDLTFFGVKGLQTMVDLNLFDNLISMDPHYKVISSDNSYTFSYKNGLEKSLIANFPSEKKAISSFFEFLSDMYEKLDYFFTAEGLTNITPLNVELAKYGNMTAQSYLDEIFSDSLLKQLLLASCVFYQGSPPHELSALYFFGLLSSFITNGAYYYRGGGSKLATDLSNIIISNGGKIITGMEVEKLIIQDGTVCGVSLCNGNTIESPIIIANINLCLPNFIEDPEYKIYLDKFRSRSTALSRCQVYFTVKTEREDLCPVTFLKGTFDDNEEMKSFLQDTPLSLRCFIPSVLSKQNNLHLLSVAVPAAYKSWEAYLQQGKLFYEAKKTTYSLHVIEVLKKYYKDFPIDSVEYKGMITPIDLELLSSNGSGSLYGWAATPENIGFRRFPMKTPIKGLYTSGQWTLPGGTVCLVERSARMVSELIEKDGVA